MTPININQLMKDKAERKAAAVALNNLVIAAGREMTAAETETYNGHIAEIRKVEAALTRHAELATFTTDAEPGVMNLQPVVNDDGEVVNPRASKEYTKAFWAAMRGQSKQILAALNITTPGQGGYATPIEFDTRLVEKLQNANVMRQLANTIVTTSERKILVEDSIGTADWAAEAAVAHNDSGNDDDSFRKLSWTRTS
jgi:HK97 family phage major capsid protein